MTMKLLYGTNGDVLRIFFIVWLFPFVATASIPPATTEENNLATFYHSNADTNNVSSGQTVDSVTIDSRTKRQTSEQYIVVENNTASTPDDFGDGYHYVHDNLTYSNHHGQLDNIKQRSRNSTMRYRDLGVSTLAVTAVTGVIGTSATTAIEDPNGDVGGAVIASIIDNSCTVALAVAFPPAGPFASLACTLGRVLFMKYIIGDTTKDNAVFSITTGTGCGDGGYRLFLKFTRKNGKSDECDLGFLWPSDTYTETEDLDDSHLETFEIFNIPHFLNENDSICFTQFTLLIGELTSGTNKKELLALNTGHLAYITEGKGFVVKTDCRVQVTERVGLDDRKYIQDPTFNGPCTLFGDEVGALTSFILHWPSALICRDNYLLHNSLDYAHCLRLATVSYKYKTSTTVVTKQFPFPKLPITIAYPYNNIINKYTGSCLAMPDSSDDSLLIMYKCSCSHCATNWDYGVDGRLRNQKNPTMCLDAGKRGNLNDIVTVSKCNNLDSQQWIYEWTDDYVRYRSFAYNKYLGITNCGKGTADIVLQLQDYDIGTCSDSQQWVNTQFASVPLYQTNPQKTNDDKVAYDDDDFQQVWVHEEVPGTKDYVVPAPAPFLTVQQTQVTKISIVSIVNYRVPPYNVDAGTYIVSIEFIFSDGTIVKHKGTKADVPGVQFQTDSFTIPRGDYIVTAVVRYNKLMTGIGGIRFLTRKGIRFPDLTKGFYGGYGPDESVFQSTSLEDALCGMSGRTGEIVDVIQFHFKQLEIPIEPFATAKSAKHVKRVSIVSCDNCAGGTYIVGLELTFYDGTSARQGQFGDFILRQETYRTDSFDVPDGDYIDQAVVGTTLFGVNAIRFRTRKDQRFPITSVGWYGGWARNQTVFEAKLVGDELSAFSGTSGSILNSIEFHFQQWSFPVTSFNSRFLSLPTIECKHITQVSILSYTNFPANGATYIVNLKFLFSDGSSITSGGEGKLTLMQGTYNKDIIDVPFDDYIARVDIVQDDIAINGIRFTTANGVQYPNVATKYYGGTGPYKKNFLSDYDNEVCGVDGSAGFQILTLWFSFLEFF